METTLQQAWRATASEFARDRFRESTLKLEPGYQGPRRFREKLEIPLLRMLGMSALLSGIASANVANLLIARSAVQQALV